MKQFSAFCLLILFVPIVVFAQGDTLDPFVAPINPSTPLLSLEVWEESNLEYYTVDLRIDDAGIEVQEAIAEITRNTPHTVDELAACAGQTNVRPSYRFFWERTSISEELPIRIFAVSSDDLSLVINEPDGDWLCSDDFGGENQPYIELSGLRAGTYNVWVATESGEDSFASRLFITTGDETPLDPPPACCDTLSFSNPANDGSSPSIAYVELDEVESDAGDTLIQVSIDVILRGSSGDQFIVELNVVDPDSGIASVFEVSDSNDGCEVSFTFCDAVTLNGAELRRDFSGIISVPIEFSVSSADLLDSVTDYQFSIVISKLDSQGNIDEIVDSYEIP